MAAARHLRSEDPFRCCICLDVFNDPVSTPCGHNFCKNCITDYWDSNDHYLCPMCKKDFYPRPELQVNTFISEMVSQFRQAHLESTSSSSEGPGDVLCDVCADAKLKALKSCRVCQTSYCETHLKPHLTASHLKRHQLVDAVEKLEDRMCVKHGKPLELFCKTDRTCICKKCIGLKHRIHKVVPLEKEYEEKKAELMKTESEIQQMIQERRLKIEEVQQSVELSKKAADRDTAEGVQFFNALMESAQTSLNKLIQEIEEKQRRTEKQAEDFIKELEQEIAELEKRSAEVEQLSSSPNHVHFLQTFTSVEAAPTVKTWTSVRLALCEWTVRRAVSQLEEKMTEDVKRLVQAELKRVQQFAVDVTLDPDTAHPELVLSDDGKQVHHTHVKKKLPDNPERFSYCSSVLGKQRFSSGKFYFQVVVKGKTDWDVGVVRESVHRKGQLELNPHNGFWVAVLRNGNHYLGATQDGAHLSLKSPPHNVGVFVDYEEGLVSFYDVDAAAHIYSFTGCYFYDKLLPYVSPCPNNGGKNSAPLIISPVLQHRVVL